MCRRAAGISRAWESRRLPPGSVGGDTALDQSGANVHEPFAFYIVDVGVPSKHKGAFLLRKTKLKKFLRQNPLKTRFYIGKKQR